MSLPRTTLIHLALLGGLVFVAVLWRLINNVTMIAPNVELVTAVSLVAAVYLRKPFALAVPIRAMLLSDVIIGGAGMALFTWSAFILVCLSGLWLKRLQGRAQALVLASAGIGLAGAVFFFLWTNFGVWLLGGGSFYPYTWQGLMLCYAYGLPFFRGTLISGLLLAPAVMLVAVSVPKHRTLHLPAISLTSSK